jgi:hypothetical protein
MPVFSSGTPTLPLGPGAGHRASRTRLRAAVVPHAQPGEARGEAPDQALTAGPRALRVVEHGQPISLGSRKANRKKITGQAQDGALFEFPSMAPIVPANAVTVIRTFTIASRPDGLMKAER